MATSWVTAPVIYQIYPRSFADSNGDGSGDLQGIIAHLDYIKALGVDGMWLSPCYVSPQCDGGYDIADYRHIDPLYGSDADFQELLEQAHARGLRVMMDMVPNHSSDQHRWFQEALAAGPNSAARERYWFRDSDPNDPLKPPNNWKSIFGGPAWTRVCDRPDAPGSSWEHDTQWYLHIFDPAQPDLNWECPQVHEEFADVIGYWLRQGVDGFRVDVAQGMVKDPALPDLLEQSEEMLAAVDYHDPRWDQEGVHAIYQQWRKVADEVAAETGSDIAFVGELWVSTPQRRYRYLSPTEMNAGFVFDLLMSPWEAPLLRQIIDANVGEEVPVEQRLRAAWVLSNHDSVRHASRFGLIPVNRRPNGIGVNDPQPDAVEGLRRARGATLLMLALPGSAYLYQGEELGLPDHLALRDEERLDPTFVRSGGRELGRDGCRSPLPWQADAPFYGFTAAAEVQPEKLWLPQPESFAAFAADQQEGVADSTLSLYRQALRLRHERSLGISQLEFISAADADYLDYVLTPLASETLADAQPQADPLRARTRVISALANPVRLPQGWRVILASEPLDANCSEIPVGATVWLEEYTA